MAEKQEIKLVYPLSPMQSGMLYHSIREKSNAYFEQWEFTIHRAIDKDMLESSFDKLIDRYDIFRTIFVYEALEEPVQVVLKEGKAEIYYEDLGALSEGEQGVHVEEFKRKDKERGFELSKDMLIRLSLFRRGESSYTLVWTFHHILMDGWCLGIILDELMQIYASIQGSEILKLTPVTPYRNYIKWLEEQDKDEGLRYWRQYLGNYDRKSSLTRSHQVTGDLPYRVEEYIFRFDKELSDRLREIARENRVTAYTVFQTLWGILLQKYNNTDDVVYGVVVSGRPAEIEGIERMVGLFINTVPVRVKTRQEQQFSQLLKHVHQNSVQAKAYEYLPLADIQAQSSLKRDLIDHILVFENYPVRKEFDDAGVGIERGTGMIGVRMKDVYEQTNYNLNIIIEPRKIFVMKFNYNSHVYDNDFIKRAALHFEKTARQALDKPGTTIDEIEIITGEEKQQILYSFNDTESRYPQDQTIQQLFEKRAARTPHSIAVVFENHGEYQNVWLTYLELNEKSNQLARVLREKGVKADTVVGIMARRSIQLMVGILGILKAGGAYLPVNPGYPEEWIRYMLGDSGVELLLTRRPFLDGAGDICRLIDLDDVNLYAGEKSNRVNITGPSDLAYVMYTSGSTGKSKGVMVEHRNVIRLVWNPNYVELSDEVRVLQTGAPVFDATTFEIWGSLLNGGRLYLVDEAVILDAHRLGNALNRHKITTLWLTSPLFNQLVQQDSEIFSRLRYLLVGGDALSPTFINIVRNKNKALKVVNGYGPTENTTFSVCHLIDRDYVDNIPIGVPISNSTAYILDRHGHLQPIGAAGELWVGGDGVTRGYLNSPGLTGERFVTNSFFRDERFYKTGDIARWLPDGNIEFSGRIDSQLKIRGFRVEPGEIENVLLKLDYISEAVVIPGEKEKKHLVAYIVPDSTYSFADANSRPPLYPSELRSYLARNLPDYMVPGSFVILESLPLTPNGKIDRNALPTPGIVLRQEYLAPRDEIEKRLVEIWSDILNVDRDVVGIDSDFFDLGGHSLTAVVVVSRIQKDFDVKVTISEMFQMPTIRELARLIKESRKSKYLSITPANEKEYYALSPGQKRIYILQQMFLENTSYNLTNIQVIEGSIDKEKLESAIGRLIDRHESLRTSFQALDDNVFQKIHHPDGISFRLEYHEIEGKKTAEEMVQQFVKPFDLSLAPLLRAGLIRLEETKHVFMLNLHHIVSDGISWGILIRELFALYFGRELPKLRLQYKDFSEWQKRMCQSGELKKQEEYWLKEFGGQVPVLNLPFDYPPPAKRNFAGSDINFEIDRQLTGQVKSLMSNTKTTLFMILLAIYNILLSKYARQGEIVVGAPISGRTHADVHNIIGMFVNMLLFRSRTEGNKTFAGFLEEVKRNVLDAFENQDYQYDELMTKLGLVGNWNPLFNVAFSLGNFEQGKIDYDNLDGSDHLKIYPHKYENKKVKYDLAIVATETAERIQLLLQYSTELFKKSTAEKISEDYIEILKQVLADENKKLKDITVLHGLMEIQSSSVLKELDEFEF